MVAKKKASKIETSFRIALPSRTQPGRTAPDPTKPRLACILSSLHRTRKKERPAEAAQGEPAYNRYKLMELAWLALAEEQDWLDGEVSPVLAGGRQASNAGNAARE